MVEVIVQSQWSWLCTIEPRLLGVADWCASTAFSWHRYEEMKSRLWRLVGWFAEKDEISSSTAWNIAHHFCLDLLETKTGLCDSPAEIKFCEAFESLYSFYLNESLVAQYPVGRFRLDFALPYAGIGVEIDGREFHSNPEQRANDRERQEWIENKGWCILRFTGSEVHRDAEGCAMEVIRQAMEALGIEQYEDDR